MISSTLQRQFSGRQWYHQRFDACPLYIFVIGEAELKKESRKPKGTEAHVRICFFDDRKGDWYLDMADVKRGAVAIINRAKKDPQIGKKLLRAWKQDEQKFNTFFTSFRSKKLPALTNSQLGHYWKQFCHLFLRRFSSSSVIDHFALGSDTIIADMIRTELPSSEEFSSVFSILTAPVHQSFINRAEVELITLALKKTRSTGDIEKYRKRYFWIENNYYSSHELATEDVIEKINELGRSKKDLTHKQRQILGTPMNNKEAKRALFKKHHFSKHLKTLLSISEDFTWWQDERKRASYLNISMGSQIVGEMAGRKKINAELTKYLLPAEVEEWFLHSTISTETLQERQRGCCVIAWPGRYALLLGADVPVFRKTLLGAGTNTDVNELHGLPASNGTATGPVRVIRSVQEIHSVKPGDILVAVMTRPDYIAGMKRAAAIVTNEGGITSHAAIVSRELKIPCVIGTKVATEVFHDGDIVEVDATRGRVTIIERSKKP